MHLKLIKFPRPNQQMIMLPTTPRGFISFSEIGEVKEVPEGDAHKALEAFKGCLEQVPAKDNKPQVEQKIVKTYENKSIKADTIDL